MFVKGNYSFDLEIFYFRILGWWNGVCMYNVYLGYIFI